MSVGGRTWSRADTRFPIARGWSSRRIGDNQRQDRARSGFAHGIRGLVIRVNAVAASGLIEESPGRTQSKFATRLNYLTVQINE